jgi:hypothetical protein
MDILDGLEKLSLKETKLQTNGHSNRKREPARNDELRAECREMCSSEEVNMRIKNKLVHALEKRIVK